MLAAKKTVSFASPAVSDEYEISVYSDTTFEPEYMIAEEDDWEQEYSPQYDQQRRLVYCALGKDSWYCRFDDGISCWDNLPQTLHYKLWNRSRSLPPVRSLAIMDQQWIAIFSDGSIASSGFAMNAKLRKELQDPDSESGVRLLAFAPGGGWIVVRYDGTMSWERLPSGLDTLIRRRHPQDPPVELLSISMFGGWFVRFEDGECEFEGLPKQLEQILVKEVRKAPENIVCALTPEDAGSFVIAVGDEEQVQHPRSSLKIVMRWSQGEQLELPPSLYFMHQMGLETVQLDVSEI
ncbi:hypothetical protein EDD86DRAFT_206387 [Gorgonomyces haynaldii]|nr:hypothetical protein EDD86DRAFT_206387 [Gorgonomyces haynaldii]